MFGKYEATYGRLDGKWKFKDIRFVSTAMVPCEEGWANVVVHG